ncbi:restriction endonuclease subunit S [Microbacterium schleiferi]|uniref:Restriction endonuclease subunit S n=1 Tax=Microbacterium schleiferi TaxID=69362 RepID=A0ABU7V4V1_9MICO
MTAYGWMPAKRLLRPIRATSGLIKGEVAIEPAEDLLPGFSASGQDVWLEHSAARASGPGIVLSAVGARCGKTFLADFPRWGAVANTASFGIAEGFDAKYVHYILNDENFWTKGGAAQPYVMIPESLRRRVWAPPLMEQRAIADYLDRETAQIDAFIAKNEELVTLLTERRAAAAQSEVEHHVGLGSRLKFHFREIDVRAGSKWEELPLLSVSIHHGVVPRDDDSESSSEASDLSHYKVASSGDIVLNRMRAFQGGLGVAPCTGLVSPDYAVLRPAPDVDPNWLALVMRTPRFVSEMVLRLRGIGTTDSGAVRTPRISVADLGAILVSVPGSTLQAAELHAVATSTTQIEAALLVAKRSVELARERRAALISAAVTGRIDVADA